MILLLLLLLPLSVSAFSPPSTPGVAPVQSPFPKTVFKGRVYDPDGKIVARAKVFSGLDSAITDVQGNFRMEISVLDTGGIFPAAVKADGYFVKWVSVKLVPGDSTIQNITVVHPQFRIRVGVRFKPKSVQVESPGQMDVVFKFLRDCPEVSVEIQGHCFEWNSEQKNLKVSQMRAEAVRREIIEEGEIDPSRIVAVGYGSTKPLLGERRPIPRKYCTRIELRVLP
jgi:hypothetical protein